MKRCVLMLVFLMSLLAGAPASASSAGEACDGMTWPSFAEVAEAATRSTWAEGETLGHRIVLDGGPWPPQQRWPQP